MTVATSADAILPISRIWYTFKIYKNAASGIKHNTTLYNTTLYSFPPRGKSKSAKTQKHLRTHDSLGQQETNPEVNKNVFCLALDPVCALLVQLTWHQCVATGKQLNISWPQTSN